MFMSHRTIVLLIIASLISGSLSLVAQENLVPIVKIEAERMPAMNVARSGHSVFCVNNEIVVVGGHTKGFVPTATAEYFSDGRWHLVNTDYVHDDGFALVMKSGLVLIGGGHNEPLGIGQSFSVERYHPVEHRFDGFGCMDRKRALPIALETDSGKVVIAGNWYETDGIELFDSHSGKSQRVKEVAQQRSFCYLFRTSNNDVMVVSGCDNKGVQLDSVVADRLHGSSFRVPLLDTWHPLDVSHQSMDDYFVGDESKGEYAYLMPVSDKSGQTALVLVRDTVFSLLPTKGKIPMQVTLPATGQESGTVSNIDYTGCLMSDRHSQRAYLVGYDHDYMYNNGENGRIFVLVIDYKKTPATLALCYTEPLQDMAFGALTLTPQGDIVATGGVRNSNYTPHNTAYLLRLGNGKGEASATAWWPWLLVVLLLAGLAATMWYRRKPASPAGDTEAATADVPARTVTQEERSAEADALLMQRIRELMETEQPYLNANLKLADLSLMLAVNKNYVSACINGQCGCSFSHFVNSYRVEHAKTLLQTTPDIRMSILADKSGFSTESSFFRAFKAVTGMTPTEWKNRL